jgi:hypothetical protein
MFVQHHPNNSVVPSLAVNSNEDFELIIESKNQYTLAGRISFTYLHQLFEARIVITPTSIEMLSQYPFVGIEAATPFQDITTKPENPFISNGNITKEGIQNVVWLILDTIHLYNVVRFKPSTILALYREVFSTVKAFDPELVFGKIPLETPIAKKAAKLLAPLAKRKHKYNYTNPLALLGSFQHILASYPQSILTQSNNQLTGNIVFALS